MLRDNDCGSSLIVALPDDVFALITRRLTPRDVCNLCLCCRSLRVLANSDKVWLTQCVNLGNVPLPDLVEWRKGVRSYRALCRFLVQVQPLFGIWVHQNPELGNVVYVMPGFVSVVGCRIIPQELGPLGIEDGPILWAPVFEIVGDIDGSATFLLHGTERENDYIYPGSLKGVDRNCNVLLLEVESRQQSQGVKLEAHRKSFSIHLDKELTREIRPSDNELSDSKRGFRHTVSFSRLSFANRRKLIEIVTGHVGMKVPCSGSELFFPHLRKNYDHVEQDMNLLHERRSSLMQIVGDNGVEDCNEWTELHPGSCQLDPSEILDQALNRGNGRTRSTRRNSFSGYFRDRIKHLIGIPCSLNGSGENTKNSYSSKEKKYAQLHEFLHPGDTLGLTLRASTMRLSSYRAWPNMPENRYALYKLPTQEPMSRKEYAGLWGGTFGWPPSRPSADKSGKALFFLLLSYEESRGQRLLIGTKILEGTQYVLHPNGSAMFIVNADEPSLDSFPWDTDGDSLPVDVTYAFLGEGIANGYGFRYPGTKPGSLYVFQDGLLAFIWKESKAVLTLRRLNLHELLKKGERVPALPPVSNFAYLTKSYSNVFSGTSSTSNNQMPSLR